MVQIQTVPFVSYLAHSQRWVGSPAVNLSGTSLDGRKEMLIGNVAGTHLFWGSGAGLTQGVGQFLAVGQQISIPFGGSVMIFGTGSGAGSCDIRMTEFA